MRRCVACQCEIPADAQYCGFCGFRQAAIPADRHRQLSDAFAAHPGNLPSADGDPVPLIRPKNGSEAPPAGPKLVVVDGEQEATGDPVSVGRGVSAGKRPPALAPVPDDSLPADIAFEDTVAAPSKRADDTVPEVRVQAEEPLAEGEAAGTSPQRLSRRQARRFPLKVEVGMTSEHNFYTGFAENLSSGGLFVATHEPLRIGDRLEINLTVPGLERVCTALCEVRWLREYDPVHLETVPGVGLKFLELDPDARAAIELFLRHRDPIFYDED
jgi:uncharacterized protein (TIGR02266 family)